jgi:hypothetical protein
MEIVDKLKDLAKSIRYADMYDLTEAVGILKQAAKTIEELSAKNLTLKEKSDRKELRDKIKQLLDKYEIEYDNRCNTSRLQSILERSLQRSFRDII